MNTRQVVLIFVTQFGNLDDKQWPIIFSKYSMKFYFDGKYIQFSSATPLKLRTEVSSLVEQFSFQNKTNVRRACGVRQKFYILKNGKEENKL